MDFSTSYAQLSPARPVDIPQITDILGSQDLLKRGEIRASQR
jgi:hypothetical protein